MSEMYNHSNASIDEYIKNYSEEEDPVLYELFRETNKKVLQPRMLSGHIQGKILEMLIRMMQPQNVLEIGTYTGYGTICIARGLAKNGIVHTIEINDELEEFSKYYHQKAGVQHKIHTHIGKAQDIIPRINEMYDCIFIDGDKREYPEYLEITKQYLKQGGFILADNVLWNGKVLDSSNNRDKHTQGIQQFNKTVKDDPELENVIFPLKDGLMVIRKK
jgi:predicted O-methyltransferase YrrM